MVSTPYESSQRVPCELGIQPAWGFSITHAENILLRNVNLSCTQPDERPWLYQKNTKKLRLRQVAVNGLAVK